MPFEHTPVPRAPKLACTSYTTLGVLQRTDHSQRRFAEVLVMKGSENKSWQPCIRFAYLVDLREKYSRTDMFKRYMFELTHHQHSQLEQSNRAEAVFPEALLQTTKM